MIAAAGLPHTSAEMAAIPQSHADLLTRPICGVLTTMDRDGQPQSSLVWLDTDGECARVHTTLESQHSRNLARNPRVSLLVVDPDDTGRFIQIRGDAEPIAHAAPISQRARETRVVWRIRARRITVDAIHR